MPDRIPGEDRDKENENWIEKKDRQNESRNEWAFLLVLTSVLAAVYLFFIKDDVSPNSFVDNILFLYSIGGGLYWYNSENLSFCRGSSYGVLPLVVVVILSPHHDSHLPHSLLDGLLELIHDVPAGHLQRVSLTVLHKVVGVESASPSSGLCHTVTRLP